MSNEPLETAGEPSTVTDYLEDDHRRLDTLLNQSAELSEAGRFADALVPFRDFAIGLSRHIDVEEQVLFPTFERLAGSTNGPTAVMRIEHVEIRRWLNEVRESLATNDLSRTQQAIRALVDVLSAHNMKEEAILYPMTDRWMSTADERRELVQRLRSF